MKTRSYKTHIQDTLRLALPVSMGQIGIMIAGLADNMMVGQLGYKFLAASSFANAIQVILLFFGTGFSIAITPIVGKAFGAKDKEQIDSVFRNGLVLNTLMGVLLFLIMTLLYFVLDKMGQEAEVVQLARPYFFYLALTLIPHMIFMHFKQFSEGLQKTVPAMIIGLIGNAMNIGLNYLLIYGKFGFPRMELAGAGAATLFFRVFIVVAFFVYFYNHNHYKGFLNSLGSFRWNRDVSKQIVKTGLPIGAQFSLEAAGFAVGAIMVGWISSVAQAAHQIAMNISATTYLAASGLSSAATIRISHFLGEKRYSDLRRAGYSTFLLVTIFMAIMAISIIGLRDVLPHYFVNDIAVINIATQLLIVAAFFQLFDGIQVAGLGTQRGIMDVKFPTLLAVLSYWMVGIPISYFMGIKFGYGAFGVWVGFAFGLATAAVGLLIRFVQKTKQMKS